MSLRALTLLALFASPYSYAFNVTWQFLDRPDVTRLYALHQDYEGPKGPLVILPGLGEPAGKYKDVLQEFSGRGFGPIWVLDHRGQGRSSRLLPDSLKGHIESFDFYIEDTAAWLDKVGRPASILAHSMGAAIALGTSIRYGEKMRGITALSSMLKIQTSYLPEGLALGLTWALVRFGYGIDFIPGASEFESPPFEKNRVTRDRERWQKAEEYKKKNPHERIASPTNQWLYEALVFSRSIREQAKNIQTPLLFLVAQGDDIVSPEAQIDFCAKAQVCRAEPFRDAKHELLQEIPSVRNKAIQLIDNFLSYRRDPNG